MGSLTIHALLGTYQLSVSRVALTGRYRWPIEQVDSFQLQVQGMIKDT